MPGRQRLLNYIRSTSGTEPKVSLSGLWTHILMKKTNGLRCIQIKYYLEGSSKNAASVAPVLAGVVQELAEEWMQAGLNGLGRP